MRSPHSSLVLAGETSRQTSLETTEASQRRRRRHARFVLYGGFWVIVIYRGTAPRRQVGREAADLQASGDEVARLEQPVHDGLQEEQRAPSLLRVHQAADEPDLHPRQREQEQVHLGESCF